MDLIFSLRRKLENASDLADELGCSVDTVLLLLFLMEFEAH